MTDIGREIREGECVPKTIPVPSFEPIPEPSEAPAEPVEAPELVPA